jgi:hypothetical protein
MRFHLAVLLVGGALSALESGMMAMAASESQRPTAVCPGITWQLRTPEQVGLSRAKLEALRDFVGGRGCVVRHGYMVYTWGDPAARTMVLSAAKPWISHFLFKAVEEGRIPSLGQKVSVWEPRLSSINAALGYKDRDLTWRHMANQISGYGNKDKPGAAFNYNDYQMALLFDTLMYAVVDKRGKARRRALLAGRADRHLRGHGGESQRGHGHSQLGLGRRLVHRP